MPPHLKQLLAKLHGGHPSSNTAEASLLWLRSQAADSSVGRVQELLLGSRATQLLKQKKDKVRIKLRELLSTLQQQQQQQQQQQHVSSGSRPTSQLTSEQAQAMFGSDGPLRVRG